MTSYSFLHMNTRCYNLFDPVIVLSYNLITPFFNYKHIEWWHQDAKDIFIRTIYYKSSLMFCACNSSTQKVDWAGGGEREAWWEAPFARAKPKEQTIKKYLKLFRIIFCKMMGNHVTPGQPWISCIYTQDGLEFLSKNIFTFMSCTCMRCRLHMGFRGQLASVSSLPPACRFQRGSWW